MKEFKRAEIEVIRFAADDVITTSSCGGPGTGTNCLCVGCYSGVGCPDGGVGCKPDNYGSKS